VKKGRKKVRKKERKKELKEKEQSQRVLKKKASYHIFSFYSLSILFLFSFYSLSILFLFSYQALRNKCHRSTVANLSSKLRVRCRMRRRRNQRETERSREWHCHNIVETPNRTTHILACKEKEMRKKERNRKRW
jgi:hypothetical protein